MMRRQLTLVELCVIMVVMVIFLPPLMLWLASGLRWHESTKRSTCASNLKMIHWAMQQYSENYNGYFPMVTFGSGVIAGEDKLRQDLLHRDKVHSVSENLWLLCVEEFAQPEIFNCPSSDQAGQRLDEKYRRLSVNLKEAKDFPWSAEFSGVMSYSFIQPWSALPGKHTSAERWRNNSNPRGVLGADGNNGQQPDYNENGAIPDAGGMRKYVNSTNHYREGQNILYGDGHVAWSKTGYAGLDEDNIYTAQKDRVPGGVLSVRPENLKDTVLIPNAEVNLEEWNRKP